LLATELTVDVSLEAMDGLEAAESGENTSSGSDRLRGKVSIDDVFKLLDASELLELLGSGLRGIGDRRSGDGVHR
jgi:hypothetical protein